MPYLKKRRLLFTLMFLIFNCCFATGINAKGKNPMYSIIKSTSGLYGYINQQGQVVIKPQFESAYPFADNGLAKVSVNNRTGFINKSGEFVIKPQYGPVSDFGDNGLAAVEFSGEFGFINESNERVIRGLHYDYVGKFSQGLANFSDFKRNTTGYINESGQRVIEFGLNDFRLCGDAPFSNNGLACIENSNNNLKGYINTSGQFVIEPQFKGAGSFAANGLAIVKVSGERWGFINATGQFVIQPQYTSAGYFANNGLAYAEINGKNGFIDSSGNFVIQPQFESVFGGFESGLAEVRMNGRHGYINEQGQWVSDYEIPMQASEGKQSAELTERHARNESEREARRADEKAKQCDFFYTGKVFQFKPTGLVFLGTYQKAVVLGVDKDAGLVSFKVEFDGRTVEESCQQVRSQM